MTGPARTVGSAALRPVTAARQRARDSVVTLGRVVLMTGSALRHLAVDVARGRFHWKEFVAQAWFVVGVAVVPTLLVAIPFGVIISIQVGSLAEQVGATSFIGAVSGRGVIRQGAPIVTSLLLAGAVGSAVCSDLGARAIREEIDALAAMGIPPVQRLVAPRMLAITLVGMLLCGLVAFIGVLTAYLFNIFGQEGTPGSFVESFASFAEPADLVLAIVKAMVFGVLVAAVACHKGITATGGPKGVADAVNASVVLSVVLLFAVNLVITQVYATLFTSGIG
jgi:phospholipid/cholesterol/gamma-HCH transport system permease protein